MSDGFTRRSVLAAGALAALATPVAGGTPLLKVPQVDRLRLQVVTDAATFGPFLPNLDLPGMTVIRAGNGGPQHAARMLLHPLLAEFGLSISPNRGGPNRRAAC